MAQVHEPEDAHVAQRVGIVVLVLAPRPYGANGRHAISKAGQGSVGRTDSCHPLGGSRFTTGRVDGAHPHGARDVVVQVLALQVGSK